MGFLGIGTWEILLILVLALIVLGPGKLPGIARTMGRTIRAIKKASADLTTTVTRELEAQENAPPSTKPAGESNVKTGEAPSAVNKTSTQSQDDRSTKPGGASVAK